jgi:glutathione-regulated potassium-efflux system ancillary protein KefC
MRELGFVVYYGDTSRLDLLRAAGADKANLMIIAVDNPVQSLRMVDLCQQFFPNLELFVRARNRDHAHELVLRGVTCFEREMFEGSLALAKQALKHIGLNDHKAENAILRVRPHDNETLRRMAPHYQDLKARLSMAEQARLELENLFQQDRDERNNQSA